MASKTAPYRRSLLSTLLLLLAATTVHAEKLTLERIFAAPDLSGPSLRSPQISPDGRFITYLRGSDQNKDRLDLWGYDVPRRQHRLLVDARRLAPEEHALSTEEKLRRERQRTSTFSGIVEYEFSRDSRFLLVPLEGDLYIYDLHAAPDKAVRRLTNTPSYETDARFSPRGHYVSFIRDGNLIIYDLASGTERAVTRDAAGAVSYGTAEFVAQEEMARTTGYWWSPDEKYIAFTRVDESPVHEVERVEIDADRTRMVKQRYPAAGESNAIVQLFVVPTGTPEESHRVAVDLGPNNDIYLARVNWFPDSNALAVQRQSRDQRSLTLLKVDVTSGHTQALLEEHSDTWVQLTDNLTFLAHSKQFIWSSSRTGHQHLYLYDWSGSLVRALTHGDWDVTGDNNSHGMRGVDEQRGLLYFMANADTPLERHLYSASFADPASSIHRITTDSGWHSIAMADNAHLFLDTFSTPEQPASVTLRSADGAAIATLIDNRITPEHPYAPFMSEHVPTEFGTLRAADGQTLYYEITKPRAASAGKRYPVIVYVYGGPGVQVVRKAWGADARSNEAFIRQYFAQSGYVIFTLDNRGSAWRGTKFETAQFHHLGSVEVQDQLVGIDFLKSQPYVDAARLGVFGWSYGGYMALMCLLQAPEVFAAGVAGAPVTDWTLYDTHYTERYMGTPQANQDGYRNSSVLHYVSNLKSPLLIMHGMADDNVLFVNSTLLFKKLQDLDRPFEMMTYPGSKHSLTRHADTGPHAYMTIRNFLDRTIGRSAQGNLILPPP